MSDDYSFLWIFVWLGILLWVVILFRLPPKHTDLKHLLLIVTAFLILAVGGPFHIKSTWDKYHDFDSGRIRKITDTRRTIADYQRYGPKAPAITASLIYVICMCALGACVRAQYREWRYKKPWF